MHFCNEQTWFLFHISHQMIIRSFYGLLLIDAKGEGIYFKVSNQMLLYMLLSYVKYESS